MIRPGVLADLSAASDVYRSASLSNAGDRDNLLAHPEYLVLRPEGLAEGRTYIAEEDGSLVGFATWLEAGGIFELEDLFVDPAPRARRTSVMRLTSAVAIPRRLARLGLAGAGVPGLPGLGPRKPSPLASVASAELAAENVGDQVAGRASRRAAGAVPDGAQGPVAGLRKFRPGLPQRGCCAGQPRAAMPPARPAP